MKRRLTIFVICALLALLQLAAMRDVGNGTAATPDIRFMLRSQD